MSALRAAYCAVLILLSSECRDYWASDGVRSAIERTSAPLVTRATVGMECTTSLKDSGREEKLAAMLDLRLEDVY